MFKNLQIKFLKYQKVYLQGKVILNKAESAISRSKKLQIIGLTVVMGLAVGGVIYSNVLASSNINSPAEEENSAAKFTESGSLYNIATKFRKMIIGIDVYSETNEEGETVGFRYEGSSADGALGSIASATGSMYLDGPVGTQQYLAYLGQKAKIGPSPLYAQSTVQGFNILQPVIKLWEWARNIVYVFYVIVFIVIGVMIILRHRIGGQVPVTIINSIPSVIISLILVTFSYAISGLIIDGMHLATGVIHAGFFGTGSSLGIPDPNGTYAFQSPEMSVFKVFGTAQITDFGASFNIDEVEGLEGAWVINMVIGVLEEAVQWNTLVSVVLSIAAVAAMFKIFFTLLTKYLGFMMAPVLAPFQFFLGSLPGKNALIWEWFKGMLSSVGAFVGIYIVFCLMIIITDDSALQGWSWFPPLTGFSATRDTIAHLLGYSLFIAAPNIPALIEKALDNRPSQLFDPVGSATLKAASKVPLIGGFLG